MAGQPLSPIFNLENLGTSPVLPSPMDGDMPELFPMEELPDGSSVFGIGPETTELEIIEEKEDDFHKNLAEDLDESTLNRIAADLLSKIKDDLEARKGWELALDKGIKYLGLKVEESRNYPFMNACSAFDCTLSTATFRFWATTRSELLPAQGPCRAEIAGPKTEESESRAERIKAWMNYYLTKVDKGFYPDFSRMILFTGLAGSTFRKVYQDPFTNRPMSRFIEPHDFIIDKDATSIHDAGRLTQRMVKTQREIKLLQLNGYYRDTTISDNDAGVDPLDTDRTISEQEGVDSHSLDLKPNLTLYECHADIELNSYEQGLDNGESDGIPKPYIVTMGVADQKVLAIYRNWKKEDTYYNRIKCFIRYDFLPGLGVYSIGYAQLLGSNAIALTSVLRQLIDAGTLKNFPGGLRVKGLRIEETDINIGPSEFREIETGGLPIKDAIMPMPYNEPSQVLNELRNELAIQTQQLAATADIQLADLSNETPVGTTMAMLEVQTKVQSSILRSMHMSLTEELELFFELFAEGLEDDPGEFYADGMNYFIRKEDFSDDIRVVPVSDPNLTTSTQRLLRAEAILRLAQSNPEIHDIRNAYKRMYMAMNVEDIDSLLPPEEETQPLDPITENKHALEGKGLKAAPWQDQDAHLALHQAFSEANPDVMAIKDHIFEHRALKYVNEIQAELGIELPAEEMLKNPEIQNQIAVQAAQNLIQKQQQEQANQITPEQIALADIAQHDKAAELKNQEAAQRVEVEAFKAQTKADIERERIEADLAIAEERAAVDREAIHVKAQTAHVVAAHKSSESNKGDKS